MQVVIRNLAKKFEHKWVFKNLEANIEHETKLAITGKNGSGKSTLLLMIAGYITPSAGEISWRLAQQPIRADKLYQHIAIASPYLELIEDFSLIEMIRFHEKFKPFAPSVTKEHIIELSGLGSSRNKQLRKFSSGMKQRVKLLLAITGQADLVLLDEPCSNLDADGIAWYHRLLHDFSASRSIVIASNLNPEEYPGVNQFVAL